MATPVDMTVAALGLSVPPVHSIIAHGNKVVDCGCYGWRLAAHCEEVGATLIGVDIDEPPNRPPNAAFAGVADGAISLPDEYADVVVASHVLEHVANPVKFFWELMRIAKQDALIWVEAPSELSALPPGSNDAQDHTFASFWDDPTHVRPWSPGAMYRLALSCHCIPLAVGRCDAGGIPATRMIARKPSSAIGAQQPRYVSLLGVPPGVRNAWTHVWGDGQR